jgi:hypothetical protein
MVGLSRKLTVWVQSGAKRSPPLPDTAQVLVLFGHIAIWVTVPAKGPRGFGSCGGDGKSRRITGQVSRWDPEPWPGSRTDDRQKPWLHL